MKNPGNSRYVKRLNRMVIVNMLKENELMSRQQIAELTGLTPAAITGIIRELMDMGFVKEVGLGKSQGGRRPIKLQFNCTAGYVVGIEVTSQEINIAIADLKNKPDEIRNVSLDMTDPERATAELIKIIRKIMGDEEHQQKNFLGIAIAFPGQLNLQNAIVKRAVNLGLKWNDFPLKQRMEQQLKLPVFIETNSKVAALGEKWFGGGTYCDNLIYINMGEGISAGIIMGDHILQGSHGYAGQIGHTIMMEQGPLCNCGNRGCLEAICGIPALVRKAMTELPFIKEPDALKERFEIAKQIQIQDILEIAIQEDSYARTILRQAGKSMGTATANMINLFNPNEVFIGGKLAVAADVFLDDIRNSVNSYVFPELRGTTRIKKSKLGAYSGVIGACALALTNLLKKPESLMFDDFDNAEASKYKKSY